MGVGRGGNCGGGGEGVLFSVRGKPIHRVKYSGMGAEYVDLEVYEYLHGWAMCSEAVYIMSEAGIRDPLHAQ